MDDKNTSTTLFTPKLTTAQAIRLGNILAFLLLGIVIIQAIWFRETPWYIYALELIHPIIIAGYHLGVYLLYRSWKEKHEKIASTLGMTEADYYKQALDPKRHKNFFELKLLKLGGNLISIPHGMKLELPQGVTWSEARKLVKQAEKRLVKTQIFAQAAGRVDLNPRDATYVRNQLAVANFQVACATISAVRRRNKEKSVEAGKVLKKAKEAHCFSLVLQRFKDKKFDPEEARNIIILAIRIKEMARNYDLEKEVIAELENGELDAAKEIIIKAQERKILEEAREEAKEDLLSKLRDDIDNLNENFERERLLKDLKVLERLEFDTPVFWASAYELEDQILRFEIKTQTTG